MEIEVLNKNPQEGFESKKWEKLINLEDRIRFNSSIRDAVLEDCSLVSFCENLVSSGKEALEIEEASDPD